MPRVAKKWRLAELGLDGPPTKLTREYLLGRNRAQIQTLAKRYDIKANLKTEAIIKELLVKEEQQEGNLEPVAALEETVQQTTSRTRRSDVGSTDPGDTHTAKPRPSRGRATPYQSAEEREALKNRGGSSKRQAKDPPDTTHLTDPTVKDVRRVRRLLATLTKDRLEMQKEVETTRLTLAYAQQSLARGRDGVKALSWRRELYERDIVTKMKTDRTLWDGSPHMAPKHRNEWAKFLGAHWERPVNHESSSEKEIEGDDGVDGDNEMSDGDVPSNRPVPQAAPQEALQEVDYDDIYV